jgi:hypothetical protein
MPDFPRIAVINTGWSADYRGAAVRGNFGYLAKGVGHEKFNFLPDRRGRFYAYTPPLGEHHSPPMPSEAEDWLVFAVSRRPGCSGLYMVGWYEGAAFARGYVERPDAAALGEDSDGGRFTYTLHADRAYQIPLALRDRSIRGDHIKRSYAYLRGNGATDAWRAKVAKQLLAYRTDYLERLGNAPAEETPKLGFCGSAKRRKEIEEKAVAAVKAALPDWHWETREAEKCGYDLQFAHKTSGDIWHVEVKGTSYDKPHFFITINEHDYAQKTGPNDRKSRTNRRGEVRPLWRLAVVHDVDRRASVVFYTYPEMTAAFDLLPYAFHATLKPG